MKWDVEGALLAEQEANGVRVALRRKATDPSSDDRVGASRVADDPAAHDRDEHRSPPPVAAEEETI
jgi:hypothetical protein